MARKMIFIDIFVHAIRAYNSRGVQLSSLNCCQERLDRHNYCLKSYTLNTQPVIVSVEKCSVSFLLFCHNLHGSQPAVVIVEMCEQNV